MLHSLKKLTRSSKRVFDLLNRVTIDYTEIVLFQRMLNVVARVGNRMFVGLPTCSFLFFNLTDKSYIGRNKEYLEYTIRHAIASAKVGMVIRWFPKILKGIASRLIVPDIYRGEKITYKHLAPVIEERRKLQAEGGPKSVRILSWMLTYASLMCYNCSWIRRPGSSSARSI